MAKRRKKVSKEVLDRWTERCAMIRRTTFDLGEDETTREARIARALKDYNFFVKTYFPHLATCDCAHFQIDAANKIAANDRITALFEWARGHAKSTHISCLIPLWLLARRDEHFHFLVLVSKSEDLAISLLSDLQAELANNDAYQSDFDIRAEKGTEWQTGRFSIAEGVTFVAKGRGQSPRGLKKRGQRPDYIVVDDIDDDLIIHSEARVSKALEWLLTALMGTMDMGRGRFTMVGNRIGKTSILARYAEREGIYHTIVNAIDRSGQPSWREKYTIEEINDLRTRMGERNFNKEYQNNPTEEGSVFRREWIQYGKMLRLRDYVKLIAYTDPSWKSSKKNDYKATLLVGKTKEGYYHVIKAFAAQTTVREMVSWHYLIDDFVDGKKPVRHYIEANLIQDLLLDEFKKEGIARGGRQIPITPDKRKKPDKYSRITAMQPLFERAFILLNEREKNSPGMRVLVEQLLATEPGSTIPDDATDALEGAVFLLNKSHTGKTSYYIPTVTDIHY